MTKGIQPQPALIAPVYVVKSAFKYGTRTYQPGEVFSPMGERWDKQIMEHKCRVDYRPVGGAK